MRKPFGQKRPVTVISINNDDVVYNFVLVFAVSNVVAPTILAPWRRQCFIAFLLGFETVHPRSFEATFSHTFKRSTTNVI